MDGQLEACTVKKLQYETPKECSDADAEIEALQQVQGLKGWIQLVDVFTSVCPQKNLLCKWVVTR